MIASYVSEMVELIDGTQATRTMVDIVFDTLMELATQFPVTMTELVNKSRNDDHQLTQPTLGQIAQKNLVRLNGKAYGYIRSLVLTMMDGQKSSFRPVHPCVSS